MKKVLFLIFLLFLCLETANVKAQVRIGGNTPPNPAAALDLNANDDATPVENKGALALPRISLASTTAQLNGATPINGMLVYNTNTSMINGKGVGIYYWDGSSWLPVASSPTPLLYALKFVDSTQVSMPAQTGGVVYSTTMPNVRADDWCVGYGLNVAPYGAPTIRYQYWTSQSTGTPWAVTIKCYRLVLVN